MKEQLEIKDFSLSWYTKNSIKSFFKKVGHSFGFVIVLMPIFGVIFSIGNIIAKYESEANIFAKLFTSTGSILFSNIGLWFTIAIIIGFTSNKGVAVYSGIIFYLIFNIFISSFISIKNAENNLFNIWFWKNLNQKTLLTNFFFGNIKVFNSGVIGGIIIGTIVTISYKKFKNITLPKGLSFFEKERFVLLITPIFAFILASLFIIIWPLIGIAMSFFGSAVAKSPIGLDAFIFRTIQRMLIPFGSSLLWQSPMWYSQIGGELANYQQDLLIEFLLRHYGESSLQWKDILKSLPQIDWNLADLQESFSLALSQNSISVPQDFNEQIKIWFENTQYIWDRNPVGDQFISIEVLSNNYITIDDCWNVGLRVTRFLTGGFVNSMFTLPAIAFSMLLVTPKGQRRAEVGMYITASLTAFLIGVTELIEFLFCYSLPLFYFAIYCPFNGLIAMITSLFKVKIGTTFSTGLMDFTFNGVIPTVNGQNTNIWILPIIGIFSAILIFIISQLYFKKVKFNPSKILDNKNSDKDKVLEVLSIFDGIKNIIKIEIKDNNLLLTQKNQKIDENWLKWFDSIKNQNHELALEFKQDKTKIIELFVVSLNSNFKIREYKKQDLNKYKEIKTIFKNKQ
ncbi:PTS transporter subunit EIIC [Spiroplasma taiwanense]|uniref:PTS system glucose-specific IIBC component n=1 Tax=Spiroplasma taiwanense CT-1 TaxID=1276220 RepID=S5LZJ5_9MOLU|nr:PTS transporter subunit EIIC [Spiroplasma taiwanense]AGR41132.1 PTS system glucose-specific IIBC component [Spiroplasma taiwanense CT-1]